MLHNGWVQETFGTSERLPIFGLKFSAPLRSLEMLVLLYRIIADIFPLLRLRGTFLSSDKKGKAG